MNLQQVKATPIPRRRRRRIGRGPGSGWGKTSGRGMRGAKSRSGSTVAPLYEGGQMRRFRLAPKRGFRRGRFRRPLAIVNLCTLQQFPAGTEVTPERLKQDGLVNDLKYGVKVLAKGELDHPLSVAAHQFSQAAVEKIEAAGGTVVRLEPPPPPRAQPEK